MGVKITGTIRNDGELTVVLQQIGDRARKHAIEFMREEALTVGETAVDFAPVDEGNLQDAIKVDDIGGGRDSSGRFVRKGVAVYVDQNAPGSGGAETVEQYMHFIHDGFYNLGPKSLAKAALTGAPVGRRFLARALEHRAKDVLDGVTRIFRRYMS